jgi:DNA-binding MarR family transcriptional regulator
VVVEAVTASGEHPVADGLIRLSVLTQSAFTRVAERHGLPTAQARLLCVLAGGARGMSELASLLGIEKAALTGLADRAERRGLIARTAVPGDRRALSVALTPGGRDAASAFHRELSTSLSQLTEVLPPAERARFCRSLARVTAGAPWPVRVSSGPSDDPDGGR